MARLHRMDFSEPIAREKAEQMTWTTIYRVCGEISVSRSIGDPDYKTFQPGIKKSDGFFIWPDGHDQVCCHSFLFCLSPLSYSFLLKFYSVSLLTEWFLFLLLLYCDNLFPLILSCNHLLMHSVPILILFLSLDLLTLRFSWLTC